MLAKFYCGLPLAFCVVSWALMTLQRFRGCSFFVLGRFLRKPRGAGSGSGALWLMGLGVRAVALIVSGSRWLERSRTLLVPSNRGIWSQIMGT